MKTLIHKASQKRSKQSWLNDISFLNHSVLIADWQEYLANNAKLFWPSLDFNFSFLF